MKPGEQPHRARLNLPAEGAAGSPPSDEVDGSGSGTIWDELLNLHLSVMSVLTMFTCTS